MEDARNTVATAYASGLLEDEEFLKLYDDFKPLHPSYPYWDFDPFSLDSFDSYECEAHFRVAKHDLPILLDAFQVPETFKCPQGTVCSGMEGLCLMLKRLAYPCRYFYLIPLFGHSIQVLCMITNTVLDWFCKVYGFRLSSWNKAFLSPANLEQYANAIIGQGSPLTNCLGFVDGTVHPIYRPGEIQHIVYNGHARKFQSLALPNGLNRKSLWPCRG